MKRRRRDIPVFADIYKGTWDHSLLGDIPRGGDVIETVVTVALRVLDLEGNPSTPPKGTQAWYARKIVNCYLRIAQALEQDRDDGTTEAAAFTMGMFFEQWGIQQDWGHAIKRQMEDQEELAEHNAVRAEKASRQHNVWREKADALRRSAQRRGVKFSASAAAQEIWSGLPRPEKNRPSIHTIRKAISRK